ncbi:hypothetical protein BIFGAL_03800 [Bifidobacterium gallicum DSM 20093 = LMG 11596]|uniref:Uncharacterized protein n=1 Tax=Bifidobacterium gallicum DSM 20093 = LMG 11596 TaxID=561180 RepID=D1NVB6_9BIFI|nr:hypothetical protein BIFGAL_03800 [Bifidobacterium gallicum DSM 20093 = LMG 11596]
MMMLISVRRNIAQSTPTSAHHTVNAAPLFAMRSTHMPMRRIGL